MSVQPGSSNGKVAKELEVQGGQGGEGGEEAGRAAWGGQIEFILTLVGFAVGLGNVWRFPYLCFQNGGGAFLIPYIISLLFLGIPLFYLECAIGQFVSKGPISLWRNIAPAMKGVGFGAIIVSTMIVVYYQVIVAWALYFFFASMNSKLPWTSCSNGWNTQYCVEDYVAGANLTFNKTLLKSPSEEYFYNNVLGISNGLEQFGGPRWQLSVLLMFSWVIIFIVIIKGISSLGKASYFISLFPYLLLTVMLIRGATLNGAGSGILYYLKPDFAKLGKLEVWSSAANQIFYSLGVSLGGLLAMSSFNKFNNNIMRDAILVPCINCGTSIYAGFVIFSVLGHMATTKGVPIADVAKSGPGLVFVVYPEGLATMPVAPLMAVLFFFMMTLLGFSSQFSTIEAIITAFIDEYPSVLGKGNRPMMCRAGFCIVGFLLGVPFTCNGGYYLFKIFDDYAGGYPLLVIGFMEIFTVVFIYGLIRFREDIEMMLGKKPFIGFVICWTAVTPALILAVLILKFLQESTLTLDDYIYPGWGMAICYIIAAIPVAVIFGYLLVYVLYIAFTKGCQMVKEGFLPLPDWGPALPENRTGRYAPPAKPIEEDPQEMEVKPPSYGEALAETKLGQIGTVTGVVAVSEAGGQVNKAFTTQEEAALQALQAATEEPEIQTSRF